MEISVEVVPGINMTTPGHIWAKKLFCKMWTRRLKETKDSDDYSKILFSGH